MKRRLVGVVVLVALIGGALWMLRESPDVDIEIADTQAPEVLESAATLIGAAPLDADGVSSSHSFGAHGVVLDATGRPMASTSVVARERLFAERTYLQQDVRRQFLRTHQAEHPAPVVARTTTDAKGQFRFDELPAGASLVVHAAVGAPQTSTYVFLSTATRDPITLIVGTGVALRGRVLDRDNNPIRAWVLAEGHAHTGQATAYLTPVETDRDGRFTLGACAPGALVVTVHVPGRGSVTDIVVRIPRTDELIVRFDTKGGVVFRGMVQNTAGQPLTGVRMAARVRGPGSRMSTRTTTSQRDGSYRLGGLPSGVVVGIEAVVAGYVPRLGVARNARVASPSTVPLDITMVRGSTITGFVRSGTGDPIADGYVGLATERRSFGHHPMPSVARSDAAGRYVLHDVPPTPTGVLTAEAPGFHEMQAQRLATVFDLEAFRGRRISVVEGQRLEIDLVLAWRSTPVVGSVRTPDGAGVGNAVVHFSRNVTGMSISQGIGGVRYQVRTQADGSFRHPGLPPQSQWELRVEPRDWAAASQVLLIPAAEFIEASLVVGPGATISGRALDPFGAPLIGAGVLCGVCHTTSGANGAFTIRAITPGTHRARLTMHSSEGNEGVVVAVDWDSVVTGVVLRAPLSRRVAGIVVDSAGSPVPRCSVTITSNGTHFLTTDDEGRFSLPHVPEGSVSLLVAGMDEPLVVEAPATDVRLVAVLLPSNTHTLVGLLLAPGGTPAFGGTLTATTATDPLATRTTVLQGAFRVDVVPGEEVEVDVWSLTDAAGNLVPYVRESFRIVPKAGEPIKIQLKAGASLRGQVVGEGGQPVGGAGVTATVTGDTDAPLNMWMSGRTLPRSTTNTEGHFEIHGLDATKRYDISVAPGREWSTPKSVTGTPGADLVRIEVVRAASIKGVVHLPDGTPGAGAVVRANSTVDTLAGIADAGGHFELAGAHPARIYELMAEPRRAAEQRWLPSERVKGVLPSGAPATLRLNRGARIEGRVTTEDGSTLPAFVAVQCWTDKDGDHTAQCNADGTFRTDLLPPGLYSVFVRADGVWGRSKTMDIYAPARGVALVLPHGYPIHGTVEGVSDAGFHVSVLHEGTRVEAPQVEIDGTFLVTQLDPRTVSLFAHKDDDPRFALVPGVAGRSEVTLTLQAGKSIEGRVTDRAVPPDASQQPTRIHAAQAGKVVSATVQPDGTFRIVGLPDGAWTVYADGDLFKPVRDVAVGTDNLELTYESTLTPLGAPSAGALLPIPSDQPAPRNPPPAPVPLPNSGSCGGGGGSCG